MTAPAESLQRSLSAPPKSAPPLIGFRAPEEETSHLGPTIPNPASSPEDEDLAPDFEHDYDEASDPSASRAGTGGAGSSRVSNPLAGEGLKQTFRAGVLIAGDQAHRMLARTQGQLETRLYATDEDDAAHIGDPLARIVARREGLGEVNPDTADLLSALMGLAGYASKQIAAKAAADRIDARDHHDPQTIPEDL